MPLLRCTGKRSYLNCASGRAADSKNCNCFLFALSLQLYSTWYVTLELCYLIAGNEGPEREQSYSSTVSLTSP